MSPSWANARTASSWRLLNVNSATTSTKLVLRLEPELAANGGDVAGGHAIGLEARGVDADAGHLNEAIRRHQ